jgi:hypothetical protein
MLMFEHPGANLNFLLDQLKLSCRFTPKNEVF